MSLAIGYVFTVSVIEHLEERGFVFEKESFPEQGFQSYTVTLKDYRGFQFRLVQDEVLYFKSVASEDFEPFLRENEAGKIQSQKNGIVSFEKVIELESLLESDLENYLKIRKSKNICALFLACEDLEKFKTIAQPDRLFQWQNQAIALIHMGPNCFDLLVAQA